MKKKAPYLLRLSISAVVFLSICLTFAGQTDFAAAVKAQILPAIDRKSYIIVSALLLLTILFGRFYCSTICPFGILQDIVASLSRRKATPDINRKKLRYAVAAAVITAVICGNYTLFAATDPYSNFGRVAAFIKNPIFLTGGIIFAIVIILSVWKKRIFCTSFCPLGTLLGLCAKISPFKMTLSEKCVKCGCCVSVCPTGCLSPESKTLDNERCVRCLKCTTVCPTDAIRFKTKASLPQKTDLSRRNFLTATLTTTAAIGTGIAFAKLPAEKNGERPVCPPGALTPEDFANKCTNCQLCVSACKTSVLRPKSSVYKTVHLAYGDRFCRYDCNNCCTVCPTGALKPLTLPEKQRRRIAMAQFFPEKCVGCGYCAAKCPTGAVEIKEIDGLPKAVLSAQYCIGCGACVSACPQSEKAVRAVPVVIQSTAVKPRKTAEGS